MKEIIVLYLDRIQTDETNIGIGWSAWGPHSPSPLPLLSVKDTYILPSQIIIGLMSWYFVSGVWLIASSCPFFCHLYPLFSVPFPSLSCTMLTCPSLYPWPWINFQPTSLLFWNLILIFQNLFFISLANLSLFWHQPPSPRPPPHPSSRWQSSPWPAPFCVHCSPADRGHGVGFPGKVSALPWHLRLGCVVKVSDCDCRNCIWFHLCTWVCLLFEGFKNLCIRVTQSVFSPWCHYFIRVHDTKIPGFILISFL